MLGQDPAGNPSIPFGQFENVHFARFFILPSTTDADGQMYPSYLIFLADVDGPGEAFVLQLVGAAGILLFPAIVAALPFYLALLRWHEVHDVNHDVIPDDSLIQKLAAQE